MIRVTNTDQGFVEDSSSLTQIARQPDALPIGPSIRVGSGAARWSALDNSVLEGGVTRNVTSHSGTPGGSVIATRQKVNGVDTVELIPGQPGTRTAIKMAIKDGLITETSKGFYQDTQRPEQGTQQESSQGTEQEQQQQEAAPFQDFDQPELDAWNTTIEPMSQPAFDATLAHAVGVEALGMGEWEDTVKSLSQKTGLGPEEAIKTIKQGFATYGRAVGRALEPMGLQGDLLEHDFRSYAQSQPKAYQDALGRLVQAGDTSGFRELAVRFKVANAEKLPQVQALKAAGFEFHVARSNGEVLARMGTGGWVSASKLLGA